MARKPPSVRTHQRAPDKWSVRWREGGRDREERGYPDRDAAEDRAAALRLRFRQGLPGTREPLAIGRLLAVWYDDYALTHLSQAAQETARHAIRVTLSDIALEDAHSFTSGHVYRWTGMQAEAGRAVRATNKALTVLSSAFQRGVEWGLVESNPVRGVRRLPEHRNLPNIPTVADVDHLLLTAPTERHRLMLRVASLTGIRQAELFALDWQHVHDAHLSISRALDRDGSFKTPKTGKPRRVPLPPTLAAELACLRPPVGRGLVFTTSTGTPLSRTNFVRRTWHSWRRHAAWQAATVDADWHRLVDLEWRHLRHHYASRLASVGATLLQCSRWMGHGTIRTTMDRYGFLFDDDEHDVMQALDK